MYSLVSASRFVVGGYPLSPFLFCDAIGRVRREVVILDWTLLLFGDSRFR